MATRDPQVQAHLDWLGFVQPIGLVVSAPALVSAGAILDRRDAEGQRLLRALTEEKQFDPSVGPVPWVPDFRSFAEAVLGWSFSPRAYAGMAPDSAIPTELELPLPDYGETLRPNFAVRELEPKDGASPWQLLVCVLEPGQDFDAPARGAGRLEASEHGRMERLLRGKEVQAGLLFNGRSLRLISAPRGESSGYVDFSVADMLQVPGRPICTALRLLLSESRLLSLPRAQRLSTLLDDSRKYQNEVSEALAEQVLHALYELLRGFQAADDASKGELLRDPLKDHPDEVYRALLTVILRLVFVLYAEQRDMLPEDETFVRHYSLAGLYERLREDAALFPDTMDQRYGAWAQLVVLFRMVFDGARGETMGLPERHGVLFDPDRFPFLEGRATGGTREVHERLEPPLVPDGTIYRALEKLLVLDGERISYRALDVEQIGSVYQTMMGFLLETTTGRSIAVKAQKRGGAPTAIDLEALLAEPAGKREKWLQDRTDRKLADKIKKATSEAATIADLHAALLPVIDLAATPDVVPKGAMILNPSEGRRRSGSHYTPRILTEPIVRTTLEPILARLRGERGESPRPAQILDLKVCDPAMGSGAFLVEACRQLGDALVDAWNTHGGKPTIPPDEDEVIFARRLIAQRCLYGVDRNPVAVDLAKVSLWLVTLSKDHALTFVDHALRHGDSLVGLSRKQIEAFHWDPDAPRFQAGFETMQIREHTTKISELRQLIREADESISDWELRALWDEAQFELGKVRLFGDLVLAAFFDGEKPKEREAKRSDYASAVVSGEAERYRGWLEERRHDDPPLAPFHWEIEFPEVCDRGDAGFDVMIGNPPFAGVLTIPRVAHPQFTNWLRHEFSDSGGKCDLVAFFFRRAFGLLRRMGCIGFVATNTIAQGDTRESGLGWICRNGGWIYCADKRLPWPGQAAVVVSVIHLLRSDPMGDARLNGKRVPKITSYLFHGGGDAPPSTLQENGGKCFKGCDIYGAGFLFEDGDDKSRSTPISVMRSLLSDVPDNQIVVRPYIGGREFLNSPTQSPSRYVIDFGERDISECAKRWPAMLDIVRRKVLPERLSLTTQQNAQKLKERWWQFGYLSKSMRAETANMDRFLMHPFTSGHVAFAFVQRNAIVGTPHSVLAFQGHDAFAVLQSRVHETWARFFGSSFKDDLRYSPSDCFQTFPFPPKWDRCPDVEVAGKAYYEFRAALMVRNDEGLTKTYNRFHDPDERDPDNFKLRELHAVMDHAVLDAYGWSDIPTTCEFLLDYEIDEEEWGNKKKPYRYRWPNEVRDEVLARLLELNAERAKEKALSAASASKTRGTIRAAKPASRTTGSKDMFS